MRISDWSSDVCSSDLRTEEAPARVPVGKRLLQLLSQLGPARLIGTLLFLLVAVLIARLGWQLPLTRDAERALYDARATAMAPHVGQDKRVLLVPYNDETLFNTGIRDRKSTRLNSSH